MKNIKFDKFRYVDYVNMVGEQLDYVENEKQVYNNVLKY